MAWRRAFSSVVVALFLACALLPAGALAKAITVEAFHSGPWAVEVYNDDSSDQFLFCVGSAPPQRNVVMSVVAYSDYGWGLLLYASHWNLASYKEIPLRFRIDTSPWFESTAVVISGTSVSVSVAQDRTFVELFRHGHTLQLSGPSDMVFDLAGTSQLMTDLSDCVTAWRPRPAAGGKPAPGATAVAAEGKSDARPIFTGSGVFISDDGYLLTNNHVIESCRTIRVWRNGDVDKPASIVARDTANDLALLTSELRVKTDDVAIFRRDQPVRAGESIAVYGFPLAGALSSSGNIVSGNITALAGVGDDVRYFQISAPIQPGNSGGPLLDAAGLVVGVVNAKLNELAFARETGDLPQNVNFAIKENVVTSFLEAHSIGYASARPGVKVELTAVADRAQRFTAQVVCYP
jgi:S1-C subfamily serine protease